MSGARGEHVFLTEGGEVPILFTNRALANAEAQLGRGLIAVLNEQLTRRGSLSDVLVLLRAGMEAARLDAKLDGKPVTMAQADALLDEVGLPEASAAVIGAVTDVISYRRPEGSEEPADPN